jgi:dTDP-4-amino-4,6-dideoxygalactose transaminase
MTELAAALGLAQLPKLDAWNEQRHQNAAWLSRQVRDVSLPFEHEAARHVYHLFTLRAPHRDALLGHLRRFGIEAGAYYPLCVHEQPLYRQQGVEGSFPVAEQAASQVLSLPVHPALSLKDLEQIADGVNTFALAPEPSRG